MAARNGRMRRSAPMVPAEAEAAVEARRRVGARARARLWQKELRAPGGPAAKKPSPTSPSRDACCPMAHARGAASRVAYGRPARRQPAATNKKLLASRCQGGLDKSMTGGRVVGSLGSTVTGTDCCMEARRGCRQHKERVVVQGRRAAPTPSRARASRTRRRRASSPRHERRGASSAAAAAGVKSAAAAAEAADAQNFGRGSELMAVLIASVCRRQKILLPARSQNFFRLRDGLDV